MVYADRKRKREKEKSRGALRLVIAEAFQYNERVNHEEFNHEDIHHERVRSVDRAERWIQNVACRATREQDKVIHCMHHNEGGV